MISGCGQDRCARRLVELIELSNSHRLRVLRALGSSTELGRPGGGGQTAAESRVALAETREYLMQCHFVLQAGIDCGIDGGAQMTCYERVLHTVPILSCELAQRAEQLVRLTIAI